MDPSEAMETNDETTPTVNIEVAYFLKHFLLEKAIEKSETLDLFKAIFRHLNVNDFETTLNHINETLEDSHLTIQLCICEITSKEYYCLISTFFQHDIVWPHAQFTDNQLDFLQSILKQIMLSKNGSVSSIDCLNLTKKLSKSNAQDFLIQLMEEKMLSKLSGGRLTLTPLAVGELFSFLQYHFKDALVSCEICKKPVIYSVLCPSCGIRIHRNCVERYKNNMKKPKCIECNVSWVELQCH